MSIVRVALLLAVGVLCLGHLAAAMDHWKSPSGLSWPIIAIEEPVEKPSSHHSSRVPEAVFPPMKSSRYGIDPGSGGTTSRATGLKGFNRIKPDVRMSRFGLLGLPSSMGIEKMPERKVGQAPSHVNKLPELTKDLVVEEDWSPKNCVFDPTQRPLELPHSLDTTEVRTMPEIWQDHEGFRPAVVVVCVNSEAPSYKRTRLALDKDLTAAIGDDAKLVELSKVYDLVDFMKESETLSDHLLITDQPTAVHAALRSVGKDLSGVLPVAFFEGDYLPADFSRGLRMFSSFYHDRVDDSRSDSAGPFVWSNARRYVMAHAKELVGSKEGHGVFLPYLVAMVVTTTDISYSTFKAAIRESLLDFMDLAGPNDDYILTFPDKEGKSNCWVSHWFAFTAAQLKIRQPVHIVDQEKLRLYQRWRAQKGLGSIRHVILADDNSCSGQQIAFENLSRVHHQLLNPKKYPNWRANKSDSVGAELDFDEVPSIYLIPLFSTTSVDGQMEKIWARHAPRTATHLRSQRLDRVVRLTAKAKGAPVVFMMQYRLLSRISTKISIRGGKDMVGGVTAAKYEQVLGLQYERHCEDCSITTQVSVRLDWKVVDYFSMPLRLTRGYILARTKAHVMSQTCSPSTISSRFIKPACPPYKRSLGLREMAEARECGADVDGVDPMLFHCDTMADNQNGRSFLDPRKFIGPMEPVSNICKSHGKKEKPLFHMETVAFGSSYVPGYCGDDHSPWERVSKPSDELEVEKGHSMVEDNDSGIEVEVEKPTGRKMKPMDGLGTGDALFGNDRNTKDAFRRGMTKSAEPAKDEVNPALSLPIPDDVVQPSNSKDIPAVSPPLDMDDDEVALMHALRKRKEEDAW